MVRFQRAICIAFELSVLRAEKMLVIAGIEALKRDDLTSLESKDDELELAMCWEDE